MSLGRLGSTAVCMLVCTPEYLLPVLLAMHPEKELLDHVDILSEKAMAPHSSTLAWKIPWAELPGGLQSMGSHRVGHN